AVVPVHPAHAAPLLRAALVFGRSAALGPAAGPPDRGRAARLPRPVRRYLAVRADPTRAPPPADHRRRLPRAVQEPGGRAAPGMRGRGPADRAHAGDLRTGPAGAA